MNPADAHRLQEIYRREYRSLLQYAREASPYVARSDRPVLDAVKRITTEETTVLEAFGEFLEEQRVTHPYLGSFPMQYTDLNFVAIRYLVPKLVADQRIDLAKLEADRTATADAPAQAAIERLVEVHRRHLKELESI
jgi:hypothetical protein